MFIIHSTLYPENPKQRFPYKQELKKKSSGVNTALFSIQDNL